MEGPCRQQDRVTASLTPLGHLHRKAFLWMAAEAGLSVTGSQLNAHEQAVHNLQGQATLERKKSPEEQEATG